MIDTIGFRDDLWIDWDGSVITESRQGARANPAARTSVTSKSRSPWTIPRPTRSRGRSPCGSSLPADTELIDEICAEGEKFSKQLK